MMGHSMGSYMLRKYLCLHGENLVERSLWELGVCRMAP